MTTMIKMLKSYFVNVFHKIYEIKFYIEDFNFLLTFNFYNCSSVPMGEIICVKTKSPRNQLHY